MVLTVLPAGSVTPCSWTLSPTLTFFSQGCLFLNIFLSLPPACEFPLLTSILPFEPLFPPAGEPRPKSGSSFPLTVFACWHPAALGFSFPASCFPGADEHQTLHYIFFSSSITCPYLLCFYAEAGFIAELKVGVTASCSHWTPHSCM